MPIYTKILLGMAAGLIVGLLLGPESAVLPVVAYAGKLFLRLILMIVVPLVFASLVVGVASLGDLRRLGRLGARTIAYYLATTALASTLGLAVARAVRPGRFVNDADRAYLVEKYGGEAAGKAEKVKERKPLLDTILEMVPKNPLEAAARGDMLAVIVFAIFLGAALAATPPARAAPLVGALEALNDACIAIVGWVMRLAPLGVGALMADVAGHVGSRVLAALGVFTLATVGALALHQFAVYGALVRVLGRRSPLEFFRRARPAMATAFGTSSSSATLPTTILTAEKSLGVPAPVARFVLPLGATVNMDGTAIYQSLVAVFAAQVFGIPLDLGAQATIVLMATLASVGAAGVPGGGLPTLAMVLVAVGVPAEGIALILGVDRLLDMCRTTVNVTGDLACAVYVSRFEKTGAGTGGV